LTGCFRAGSVSLAAWIGSLPLILWYFHFGHAISLFANLVVVRSRFLFSPLRSFPFFSTPLLPWLAVVFNNANWALATLVIGIVQLFAANSGGHF